MINGCTLGHEHDVVEELVGSGCRLQEGHQSRRIALSRIVTQALGDDVRRGAAQIVLFVNSDLIFRLLMV